MKKYTRHPLNEAKTHPIDKNGMVLSAERVKLKHVWKNHGENLKRIQ